mmetsp:Transcript_59756/g.141474  ORF Transcript_59756/g.141474 Transcript_59756/m.141474 type:complete len:187 (-) Transcript_59756:53-613(-)
MEDIFGCCSTSKKNRDGSQAANRRVTHPISVLGAGMHVNPLRQFGVGIALQPRPNGEYQVLYSQEGGPAFKSGMIHPGDVLVTIDSTPLTHAKLGEVAQLMCGMQGSTLRLGVRTESGQLKLVDLKRDRVSPTTGQSDASRRGLEQPPSGHHQQERSVFRSPIDSSLLSSHEREQHARAPHSKGLL